MACNDATLINVARHGSLLRLNIKITRNMYDLPTLLKHLEEEGNTITLEIEIPADKWAAAIMIGKTND